MLSLSTARTQSLRGAMNCEDFPLSLAVIIINHRRWNDFSVGEAKIGEKSQGNQIQSIT